MDTTVLYDLSYGLYAIGVEDEQRPCGCIVNTVFQISSEGPLIALSMNKDNYTYELIKENKRFSVSILSEETNPQVITTLGFQSGKNRNKWEGFEYKEVHGLPILAENSNGYMICEVMEAIEANTHYVIIAKVVAANKGVKASPMTYAYYHHVVKGKAPKNAPTYREEETKATGVDHVCSVCGYVYEDANFDQEPDSFVCPVCGVPKALFQ